MPVTLVEASFSAAALIVPALALGLQAPPGHEPSVRPAATVEIAATGVGIVLVTTELEELVSLCDRVLVMFRGAIVTELTGAGIERATILHASAGGGEDLAVPA